MSAVENNGGSDVSICYVGSGDVISRDVNSCDLGGGDITGSDVSREDVRTLSDDPLSGLGRAGRSNSCLLSTGSVKSEISPQK